VLFSPSFVKAIERFSIKIADSPRGANAGAHLSRSSGSSLEFRDFQPYSPGDDLRRIDWNIYGRSRHLFVRQFERPTAVPVYLLVDSSASMRLERPSRYTTGARVAAAVAAAALSSQNPVQLMISQASVVARPRKIVGRLGMVHLLAELGGSRPAGGTIARAIESFARSRPRREGGVLVVISDFFEDAGVEALIGALRLIPDRLVLLRITQPHDADPNFTGNLQLGDCESPAQLRIFADESARQRYRSAYANYFAALDRFAQSVGARHLPISAAADTLPQLEPLFPGGVLSL
jgi:uncharacterized protein (DUF58 family)